MKRRPTWRQWLSLVLSAGALVTIVVLRQQGGLAAPTQDPELERLRAEREHLSHCTDEAVLTTRTEAQHQLPPSQSYQVPTGWQVESLAPTSPNRSALRLSRVAPVSWGEITRFISTRLTQPGTRVQSLDIRSRGSRQTREIASVVIALEQPAETPSRLNPSAGTVFQEANGPANTPAVGPLPRSAVRTAPLRLPSQPSLLPVPTPGAPGLE